MSAMFWARRPAPPPKGAPGDPGSPPGLGADLASLRQPGAIAGRALAGIRALETEWGNPAARALLQALARGAESGRLGLPPFPQVVLRVRALIDSPRLRLADLDRELQCDPALATHIVGIANSPFYGASRALASVSDAVVRIGLRQTHHLLLAVVLHLRVLRVPGREAEAAALWTHSLAASLCAQALAGISGRDPEQAMLLGLVHDSGRAAILATQAELESRARGRVRLEPDALARISERLHPLLGGLLADAWGFGDELVEPIAHHHEPEAAPESARDLARLLFAADALARAVPADALPPELEPIGEFSADLLGAALEEAREAHEELGKLL